MAVAAAATSAITVASTISAYNHGSSSKPKMNKVYCVRGLNSYAGLKPENKVMSLGVAVGSDRQFAQLVTMCRASKANSGGGRGGALASTCNVAEEIARIVPIMSALVLIGVAVGFLLLRVEAAVEESEE